MEDWSVAAMRGELRRLKMELSGIPTGKLRRDQLQHEIEIYKAALEKKKESPGPPQKAKTGNKPVREIPVAVVEKEEMVLRVPARPQAKKEPTGGPLPRDYSKQVEAMRKAREAKKAKGDKPDRTREQDPPKGGSAQEEINEGHPAARSILKHIVGCLCNKCVAFVKQI